MESIKEIKKLKEAYRKTYENLRKEMNNCANDLTELNKNFYEIAKKTDEMFDFLINFNKE